MVSPPSFSQVFYSIAFIYYKQYRKFIENLFLITTCKDHKKSGLNISRKNGEIDTDRKDMKNDERDIKSFVINIKFVVDLDTNIVNSR